jgi:hypothetical protein
MNFFTVPTLTFGVLYCFFKGIVDRGRLRILAIFDKLHPHGWLVHGALLIRVFLQHTMVKNLKRFEKA